MSQAAPKPETKPEPKKPEPKYVLDTTAVVGGGPRTHEMIVDGQPRPFTFEPGKPLAMEQAIAMKFLVHEAFKLTDEKGNPLEYLRPPKQPEQLQAGEQLQLADNETVARYDELDLVALAQRAIPLPGGEQFGGTAKPDRKAMIDFIIKAKAAAKKVNASKERDIGADDFLPEAEAA